MANVPLTIVAGTLPSGAVYNAQTLFNAMVARMQCTVSDGNILWGQLGGTQPGAALPGNDGQSGLWFGNPIAGGSGYWNDYNSDAATYLPIPVVCGQYINSVLRTTSIVSGAVGGNWTLTTPDKSGVIATTADLTRAFGTQTFGGTNIAVDWSNRAQVYVVLSGNTILSAVAGTDGQIVDYYIENPTANAWTVTWATGVMWPGGSAPVMTPGVSGQRVIDHYRISAAAGHLFGEVVGQGYQIGSGTDTTAPTLVSSNATAKDNDIILTYNMNLRGGAIPVADFVVIINGSTVTVNSATANGTTVDVSLAVTMLKADTVTIKYTGTDIKAISGVAAASFGPRAVVIVSGSGLSGIHNDPQTGPTGILKSPP